MSKNLVIYFSRKGQNYVDGKIVELEKLHFRGKHVFPVMTHEGSGEANARSDLKKFCTHAKVEKAFAIQGSAVPESEERVAAWAQKHLGE